MFRSMTAALVLGATLIGGAAQAHSYDGRYYGNDWRNRGAMDRELVNSTCSGERGRALEARLRHEWREGDMYRSAAQRIQWDIDRLQDRERHACRMGDWQEARGVGIAYSRLNGRIDEIERHAYAMRDRARDRDYRGGGYQDRNWGRD